MDSPSPSGFLTGFSLFCEDHTDFHKIIKRELYDGGSSKGKLCVSQEVMECFEGNLLYDKEGTGIKEEADHGHESDDEEREALEEVFKQPHVPPPPHPPPPPPPPPLQGFGTRHHYFPCINLPQDVMEEAQLEAEESSRAVVTVPKTPEYTFNLHFDHASEFAPGEKRSPLLSPFSVRVSDYSSEDENDGGNVQVDDEAEEFIRRFYEQLRVQSRMHLLQYQEP
ncbi:hypothetical protein OIU84_016566 [Salix udensis]|uniref:Uncharacterized protein n=1 Tax=Salix udensis TaxID=889485 RepID=A0AAD6J9Y9_9ROSI|nr:hypothetical protein OIU84_016566 [Salix udensis]